MRMVGSMNPEELTQALVSNHSIHIEKSTVSSQLGELKKADILVSDSQGYRLSQSESINLAKEVAAVQNREQQAKAEFIKNAGKISSMKPGDIWGIIHR